MLCKLDYKNISDIFDLGMVVRRLRLVWAWWESLVVKTALASTEYSALGTALIAFTVFLQTFGLFAFASFFNCLWLHSKAKALSLWQILSFLIDESMYVPSECINDSLLVFFFVGGMVAAGVAIAAL